MLLTATSAMHDESLLSAATITKQLAINAGPPPTIAVDYDCCHKSPRRADPQEPIKELLGEEDGKTCIHTLRRKTIRLHHLASSTVREAEAVVIRNTAVTLKNAVYSYNS